MKIFYWKKSIKINFKSKALKGLVIGAGLVLSSCTYLPSNGPLSAEITNQTKEAQNSEFPFSLINVDENAIAAIVAHEPPTFEAIFSSKQWRPKSLIGVGDVVSVVVWEPSGQGGLFSSPDSGGRSELGPFQVPQDGKIPVPYIGQISAKGRTISELRWAVQSQLKNKAVDPQVVVSITENASNVVSVNGDARQPGQHPISLNGNRLSDIIANAGGSAMPVSETTVTLVRGNKKATQQLSSVLSSPKENIYVRPNDQIFLTHNPSTITAFGAIERTGEYPIKEGDVSLIETLGRIGGLDDNRANATGLFVFRYEEIDVLLELGLDSEATKFEKAPVIYKLNMKDGKSYFYGQAFKVRDKDIIYVANSNGSELRKFFNILSGITGSAIGISSVLN